MTKIGMFDSNISSHRELVEAVEKVLKEEGSWVSTPTLVSKISKQTEVDMEGSYIRSLLTYIRQYMLDEGTIEIQREREGGEETIYWKVIE